jgi:tRNA (guanine37-N1)-methyltransferase
MTVPEVLTSGNHASIRRWRLQQALGRTWLRRPDLLRQRCLTKEEASLLSAFQQQYFAVYPQEQAKIQNNEGII